MPFVLQLGHQRVAKGIERRLRRQVSRKVGAGDQDAHRQHVRNRAAPLDERRQEPQREPHRCKVVQRHRAFVVVEAIHRCDDRAADRTRRVVNEDVHAAVLREHRFGQAHRPASNEERSAACAYASPPAARIPSTAASSFSASRATSSTLAPASAPFAPPPGRFRATPRSRARPCPARARRYRAGRCFIGSR